MALAKGTGMADNSDRIELGVLAEDISFLSRILRSQIVARNAEIFAKHGVASGEVALLHLIARNPGISQREISRAVVLKKSALTKLVNEMERGGLIDRRKEGDDLRLNALYLTDRGVEKLEGMHGDLEALRQSAVADFSPAERAMLYELLWRLIDGLGGMSVADPDAKP